MSKDDLKQLIEETIYDNVEGDITGSKLAGILEAIVDGAISDIPEFEYPDQMMEISEEQFNALMNTPIIKIPNTNLDPAQDYYPLATPSNFELFWNNLQNTERVKVYRIWGREFYDSNNNDTEQKIICALHFALCKRVSDEKCFIIASFAEI